MGECEKIESKILIHRLLENVEGPCRMEGDASGLHATVTEGEESALSVEERSAVWRYSYTYRSVRKGFVRNSFK